MIREEKLTQSKPVDETAAWLRANLAQNIEVPPTDRLNGRPDPTRGIDIFYLGYTDRDRRPRAAHRQPLAYVFVEENSKCQTDRAENTSEVLEPAGRRRARRA